MVLKLTCGYSLKNSKCFYKLINECICRVDELVVCSCNFNGHVNMHIHSFDGAC